MFDFYQYMNSDTENLKLTSRERLIEYGNNNVYMRNKSHSMIEKESQSEIGEEVLT